MAKTQTFGDKMNKDQVKDLSTPVKVIQGYKDEHSVRYMERIVKVKDLKELDTIDIIKYGKS